MNALLDDVSGCEKARAGDIAERKNMRAKKMSEFQDKSESVLGASFDESKWVNNNKDDQKKEMVKMYDHKLLKELNLSGVE